MYGLDNASGVNVMPKITPASSETTMWFTEGGPGLAASWPGQEWFNIVQAELLGVLSTAGIKPEKAKLNQLAAAVKKIITDNNENYVPTTRTVNGKSLSDDVVITSQDVGALPVTGGKVSGTLDVEKYISAAGEIAVRDGDEMLSMKTSQQSTGPHLVSKRTSSNVYRTHKLQDASGVLMHVGDYGWGGKGVAINLDDDGLKSYLTETDKPAHIFLSDYSGTSKFGWRWSCAAYFKAADIFTSLIASPSGQGVRIVSGNSAREPIVYNILHDANTKTNHNGQVIATDRVALSDNPVGAPIPWPQSAVPSGFLACNGQSFNKTTYPLLAVAYPSGTLPDLRGEFIRGLDAGRGVDAGRTVLSAQGDAIRNITGNVGSVRCETATSPAGSALYSTASGAVAGGSGDNRNGVAISFDASRVVPTANENRPRNVAFLYIVRAA